MLLNQISFTGINDNEKEILFQSDKFLNWYNKLVLMDVNIHSIEIIKIHMFGNQLGFLHMNVNATTKEGSFIPGIVFLRGDSVFILTILEEEETGKEWYVSTYQPRIASGLYLYEIPAGMIDDNSGKVSSIALKELIEEVGEDIQPSLHDLVLIDEDSFTTPGALDESVKIYSFKKVLPKKVIDSINNKKTGLEDEDITIKLLEENNFLNKIQSLPSKYAFIIYKNKVKNDKFKNIKI